MNIFDAIDTMPDAAFLLLLIVLVALGYAISLILGANK